MSTPERPPSLPSGAVFDPARAVWELQERDEQGAAHGAITTYSVEGRLRMRGAYDHGRPVGSWSYFTDDAPGAPPLRACCVPQGARELRVRYRAGRLLDEIFYDESGRALCDDGTPWPDRAPGVPEHAAWMPNENAFVVRVEHDDGGTTLRYFGVEGRLLAEFETRGGRLRARRRYASDGTCVEDTGLDEQGKNDGVFREHFSDGCSPYADARILAVAGAHAHGERTGRWEFRAADGMLVCAVDYGPACADLPSAVVLGAASAEHDGAETRWRRAAELWSAGATRDAVALAARALAADADTQRFRTFLRERVTALAPEFARKYADAADEARAWPGSVLAAVLGGAEPAVALCTLAMSLPSTAPAALDYVDASLLLNPTRERSIAARALLCIERGDPQGALDAAKRLDTGAAATATFVRELGRVAYPRFEFAPLVDPVTPAAEELVPVEAAQPLAAVQRAVALYATRLTLVRDELRRRLSADHAWFPPDVRHLVTGALVELARGTLSVEDEDEDGNVEISEVPYDETLDLSGSVRALLEIARGDWAALSWLCWASGLDGVARPSELVARPLFAAAAHRATVRCWRAQDRLRSAGLVAVAREVPSFDWEGMNMDTMPSQFVRVALGECVEVRALFFWLLFAQNQSPFQADLRKV